MNMMCRFLEEGHCTITKIMYIYYSHCVNFAVGNCYSNNSKTYLIFLNVVPGSGTSLQVRPSTKCGLNITWGPLSGSNYPTPVTYQLRYRERPSNGPPRGWSSTVQRTATQRQYTTPVLKPGTRYEVEVWAVSSIGRGQSVTRTAPTYGCKK